MRINSNVLKTDSSYATARERLLAVYTYHRDNVNTLKKMKADGIPISEELLTFHKNCVSGLAIFYPGADEGPSVEEAPVTDNGNAEPPAVT